MKIGNKITKLYETGFFHIFLTNILNKILIFCNGIFVVKVLSKESFGIYSYSQNLLSFFLLFSGLGLNNGLLQFGSKADNENKRLEIFGYILKNGILINIGINILIIFYCVFGNFKIEEGRNILLYMSGFSIFSIIIDLFLCLYRTKLKNKEMSILSFTNTFSTVLFMILGGKFYGLVGVILGKYTGFIITLILLVKNTNFKDLKKILKKANISIKLKKEIFKYSMTALVNNSIISFIHMIDVFSIGYLIGNKLSIASYKTANIIPFGLEFIPAAIMIYIYPYFVKNNENISWIKENYAKTLKFLMGLNFIIVVLNLCFGDFIITTIFGNEYLDSVKIFKILCIGYFFTGTFRVLGANILFALQKPKFNVYSSLIASISNIVLNIVLIKKYGSIGAAYATLGVFIIWSILVNYFIYKELSKNNYTNKIL